MELRIELSLQLAPLEYGTIPSTYSGRGSTSHSAVACFHFCEQRCAMHFGKLCTGSMSEIGYNQMYQEEMERI